MGESSEWSIITVGGWADSVVKWRSHYMSEFSHFGGGGGNVVTWYSHYAEKVSVRHVYCMEYDCLQLDGSPTRDCAFID